MLHLALTPLAVLALAVPASAQSATPTMTASPTHGDPSCPRISATYTTVVTPGGQGRVQAAVEDGRRPVTFTLQRLRPGPTAIVRSTSSATFTVFTYNIGETHDFHLTASRGSCLAEETRRDVIAFTTAVTPRVSIAATRTAPRNYTFTGRVLPGRGQTVSLFRFDGDRLVLAARGVVGQDGTYRITRTFLGSGRFNVVASVGDSATNLAGQSNIRPTVIH